MSPTTGGLRRIKKYPNRRLYDTEQSRYITLDELAGLVRDGARVHVVDAKTDADLTRQVLTQVILEEQDRLDVLPVELLHLIIQVQDTAHAAPLTRLLGTAFEQFGGWARVFAGGAPGAGGGTAGASVGGGVGAAGAAGAEEALGSASRPAGPEIDALRDRMNALLGRLREG